MARAQRIAAAIAGIAAILLASLALTGVVRADEGETTAAASQALHPTQVIAEIPDGYNELFPLQWGGGSLYHLKARLATMGCIANTIWNYDDDAWHVYNQYNVPSSLNAEWLTVYEDFVPAGTLYADCFDICEFNYFEVPRGLDPSCESVETFLGSVKIGGFREGYFWHPIEDSGECTDDWSDRITARVLPSMAVYPGTCVIRQGQERFSARGSAIGQASVPFGYIGVMYPLLPNFIVLYLDLDTVDSRFRVYDFLTEIHELCHSNQYFHFIQEMQPDKLVSALPSAVSIWLTTAAGSAFLDLALMVRDADGEWSLSDDSIYEKFYGPNPIELAAELCELYFADRMGEAKRFFASSSVKWGLEAWGPDWYESGLDEFDPGRYLTTDVVEWIETWVALPEIPVPETGEAADESARDAQSQ